MNQEYQSVVTSYINGHYIEHKSAPIFDSINPADGMLIARIQSATAEDIDFAVETAKSGQQQWAQLTAAQRSKILLKAASLLRERNETLAALETLDTGKPLSETLNVDILTGVDVLEYFAGLAPALEGQQIPLREDSFILTRREPYGVTAGIGAWNYPIQIALWKSAPALAAGNAMIFKPSEMTPLSALKLAEIYTEAGVPDGVFNVVQGFGADVGTWITQHPDIEKISFTGGVETGKRVMSNSALSSLKDVTMELGGKSALIICEDADLQRAADIAVTANFFSSGQVCTNATRVFIPEHLQLHFEQLLLHKVKNIKIGSPMDLQVNFGPLISQHHREKVISYIQSGIDQGARLLCGGTDLPQHLEMGAFVMPTIFTECTDDMTLVREEIFGPVMSVLTYTSEEEVIQRANASIYGLAAGVVTPNLNRAHRLIQKLQAGICWINTWGESPAQMPVGGYKQSGLGRENGVMTLQSYTRLKSVQIELGEFNAAF